MDRNISVVIAWGVGGGGWKGGRRVWGINGDGRRLDLVRGEHTIQSTGDVLWNCASETYIILLICVNPGNSTF